jgi:hypothetical protein
VQGISSFDPAVLKAVRTVEPLTGSELAAQEIIRKEITGQLVSFDKYVQSNILQIKYINKVLPVLQGNETNFFI